MIYTAYRLPDGRFAIADDLRRITMLTADKAAYEAKLRELIPEITTDSAYANSVRRWRADHEIMTWPKKQHVRSVTASTMQGWETA